MLLTVTTLVYYGPGACAGLVSGEAEVQATARGTARVAADLVGSGEVGRARASRLKHSPAVLSASGVIGAAAAKARARAAAVIGNTGLSQGDVTGAVLEAEIEPGLSLKRALRLILAANAGKISGAGGATITIRNPGDTKSRIVATVDGSGNRTGLTYDTSDG